MQRAPAGPRARLIMSLSLSMLREATTRGAVQRLRVLAALAFAAAPATTVTLQRQQHVVRCRDAAADCTTAEAQAALVDVGGEAVFLAQLYVVQPLFIRADRLTVSFLAGARLEALRGGFRGVGGSLMTAANVSNLTIRGSCAPGAPASTWRMWREDYLNASQGYTNQGYRHGLRLENVHRATVSCLTLSDTGGDGVYIAGTSDRGVAPTPGSSDVTLSRLTLLRNQRQGMSVIGALHLLVEDSLFADMNGSEPMAGVDLERLKSDDVAAIELGGSSSREKTNDDAAVRLSVENRRHVRATELFNRHRRAARGGAANSSAACLDLAKQFCASPGLSLCGSMICGSGPCIPLYDVGATSAVKQWRCYSQRSLTPDLLHYKNGSGSHYCTRDKAIAAILRTCRLPPAPRPPKEWPGFAGPSVYHAEVFVPGEGGYPCIRIPSVALAGDNRTLNAFAECRNYTGDGCFPLHVPASTEGLVKDICQKRSTDSGKSWSSLRIIARNGGQGGNPVFDRVSRKLLLQYVQFTREPNRGYEYEDVPDLMQIESTDHGSTWSNPRSICNHGNGTGPSCSSAVGPGTGIQLQRGSHAGRILFIGHKNSGPAGDGTDEVWYSDDHGSSYRQANSSTLQRMDEGQLVELQSGILLASMRPYPCTGPFGNASLCGFRTFSRSEDQGASWGPVTIDRHLPSPACMGSIIHVRFGVSSEPQIYFSSPVNKTHRQNGEVRGSMDGLKWDKDIIPVWRGAFAYSSLTDMPTSGAIGLIWETDGPQCAAGGGANVASCRVVFSSILLDKLKK
eukprot:COSAG05_NODE_228_length_13388_cov_2.850403_2_plen_794_part_00